MNSKEDNENEIKKKRRCAAESLELDDRIPNDTGLIQFQLTH